MSRRIPAKQATAWSFSRYTDYCQCPLKFKLKHIDKIQEPATAAMARDAMARGSQIHDLAEGYIKGTIARLPKELKQFADEFRALRKQYKKSINGMVVEDTWAFTQDWDETTWNDWVGCWVRIKLDCAHHEDGETLIITDWKTGKFRPQEVEVYVEQLELYALAALLFYEHIEVVKPRLAYLDHGIVYPNPEEPLVFTRDMIHELKKTWAKRVRPMMNDKTFAPRPNNKCHWCFYRNSNKAAGGGQCKF